MPMNHLHHFVQPFGERAMRAVRLQFIVLDEVDSPTNERIYYLRCRNRRQSDARFDDGADHRPVGNATETARARDSELRTLIAIEEIRRQRDIQQLQARKSL